MLDADLYNHVTIKPQSWIPELKITISTISTSRCLQAVVAVVAASRWRYSWPPREVHRPTRASTRCSRLHRRQPPAAGPDTCLPVWHVWCRTAPADRRRTPVQQCSKLSEIESCYMYICTTVQRASRDWVTLDIHLYNTKTSLQRLRHAGYTDTTLC